MSERLSCAGYGRLARIAGIKRHSFVDGPGIRFVVFFQGCPHGCPGCHNPGTHDVNGGEEIEDSEISEKLKKTKLIDGLTLSGGEPLMQPEVCMSLAEAAHSRKLDVWCYTGWTFKQILLGEAGAAAKEALDCIDVLVDGPFIRGFRKTAGIYRGSGNQRLIDVGQSLRHGRIIQWAAG